MSRSDAKHVVYTWPGGSVRVSEEKLGAFITARDEYGDSTAFVSASDADRVAAVLRTAASLGPKIGEWWVVEDSVGNRAVMYRGANWWEHRGVAHPNATPVRRIDLGDED